MNKRIKSITIFITIAVSAIGVYLMSPPTNMNEEITPQTIQLQKVVLDGEMTAERAMFSRRSVRDYKKEPLTLTELTKLLWSAQGVTNRRGFRTAPSAGALYPLEIYVAVGNVADLPSGIYKYDPHKHQLIGIAAGDKRDELTDVALGQAMVGNGAVVIVFAAVYERTTIKYGERGIRYVHMEAGHAAQNVYLQAESLNLGTVVTGAFYDEELKAIMNMEKDEQPLYLMPVGRK